MEDEEWQNDDKPNIIQVVNVSPVATLEQMTSLFSYIDDIVNIELYHLQKDDLNFKVCFIEFRKLSSALVAQHLTNTVFIDRPLIVLPYNGRTIPDEETALASLDDISKHATKFNEGVTSHVVTGVGGLQMFATIDPKLTSSGLPQYPNLPLTTDPSRIEEIRRTLYIGNLDSTIPADQVMEFFNNIGEVKFIRLAGDDTQPTRFAFVEYYHQSSVANALQKNGLILGTRTLKINHSNNAIVKPQAKIINDSDDISKRNDRDLSRERHHPSRHDRYDRERHRDRNGSKDRDRDRDRDRYHGRRPVSPRGSSITRRKRSRDISSRHRSRSRDRYNKRSRSKDKTSRKRSRSRELKRRRSRSRSSGSSISSSRRRKSSRR